MHCETSPVTWKAKDANSESRQCVACPVCYVVSEVLLLASVTTCFLLWKAEGWGRFG